MVGWWAYPLLALLLLLSEPALAKRRKKSKQGKRHHHGGATAPTLSAAQQQAQGQSVQQGMQLAAAGKAEAAEKVFAAVLGVDPTNYPALGNRALLLPLLNRAAEGVAALEHAARLFPSDPSVFYNLGAISSPSLPSQLGCCAQPLTMHCRMMLPGTLQVNLGDRGPDAVKSFGRGAFLGERLALPRVSFAEFLDAHCRACQRLRSLRQGVTWRPTRRTASAPCSTRWGGWRRRWWRSTRRWRPGAPSTPQPGSRRC
jgi:hypothetical protein